MKWRFVPYTAYDPYVKNGLNDVALTYANDESKGLLWLSGWSADTVNIGYGQSVEAVLDQDAVEEYGVCIVRRQGGGGAVFLGEGSEVSLSMVAPKTWFPERKEEIYRRVTRVLILALERLGIPCEFEPVNDVVTLEGKKISGGTLKQRENSIYVGATLIYKLDKERMFSVLKPDKDKYLDKGYEDVKERVTSIKTELYSVRLNDVVEEVTGAVTETFNTTRSSWTEEEEGMARVKAQKYKEREWIYKR